MHSLPISRFLQRSIQIISLSYLIFCNSEILPSGIILLNFNIRCKANKRWGKKIYACKLVEIHHQIKYLPLFMDNNYFELCSIAEMNAHRDNNKLIKSISFYQATWMIWCSNFYFCNDYEHIFALRSMQSMNLSALWMDRNNTHIENALNGKNSAKKN